MAAAQKLENRRVAAIVADGFEQAELIGPMEALREQGAKVDIVSLHDGDIKGWDHDHWGQTVKADKTADQLRIDDYDAVLLPGGVLNPDKLRQNESVVSFVRDVFRQGKPIAAICHGPWTLVEADVVRGKKMTSWPSLKTDLKNAGANWVDEEVVTDNGLVTSRKPDDIPAFNRKMIEEFAEGRHERRGQGMQ